MMVFVWKVKAHHCRICGAWRHPFSLSLQGSSLSTWSLCTHPSLLQPLEWTTTPTRPCLLPFLLPLAHLPLFTCDWKKLACSCAVWRRRERGLRQCLQGITQDSWSYFVLPQISLMWTTKLWDSHCTPTTWTDWWWTASGSTPRRSPSWTGWRKCRRLHSTRASPPPSKVGRIPF